MKFYNSNFRPSPCHGNLDSRGGGGAGVEVIGYGSFGDGEGGEMSEAKQGCVILELAP